MLSSTRRESALLSSSESARADPTPGHLSTTTTTTLSGQRERVSCFRDTNYRLSFFLLSCSQTSGTDSMQACWLDLDQKLRHYEMLDRLLCCQSVVG